MVPNYLNPPGDWKPGIYDLDSYEQYDSIPALRSSHLRLVKKSPAHFAAAFDPRWKKEISTQLQKSFDKGKAFDRLMLHGSDDLIDNVTVEPDLNKNTKAYKEWKAEQSADSILLSQRELDYIVEMQRRANAKSTFSRLFGDGHPHKVIIWQDGTGIWCKAEIDWICNDGTVVDLKTSVGADFWSFSRSAYRYGYLNQGAYYLSGLSAITGTEHRDFLLAVVETEPPFESQVFRASQEQLWKAEYDNEEYLSTLAHCFKSGNWPGYPDMIMDLQNGQVIDEFEDDGLEEAEGF